MNKNRPSLLWATLLALSLLAGAAPLNVMARQPAGVSLGALTEGKSVNGFRAEALYLNDSDQPFGARLRHERTGFTLDYLEMQSVPQMFLWVNSFPTADHGEPHTQEHLLLGKGNVGRAHAGLESMSLAGSSAFTMQWRTAYHMHTAAGPEVFYKLFESQTNALLHPDYTDEEIRREVSHWGVSENPADKKLELEEKGTVYQEMASTYERPVSLLFREINQMLYGDAHPLALSAGGWPSSIREMKPEHIRKFHSDNYRLGNMGMLASFPKEMPLASVLTRLDQILNRLEPKQERRKFASEQDLPAPQPQAEGLVELVEYPHKNEQQPGWVMFAWPATLRLDTREKTLLNLFLQNVASDPTTNLYKLFVDTKTKTVETGAKGVFAFLDDEMVVGNPVYVGLSDVQPAHMTPENVANIRQRIMDEMKRIASLPDGSPELAEFNARMKSRVIEQRRTLAKFVNSPPGFGFRNSSSGWMTHLQDLNRTPGFRKSVTLKPELAEVDKLLDAKQNAWRPLIARWRLADVRPYGVAAKPAPQLIAKTEQEAAARAAAELARLKAKYSVADEQEALRRFKTEYDAETAALEKLANQTSSFRFIDNPPLTLDDQLDFRATTLGAGVPLVASTFENMTSATTGVALRLDGVPEEQLVYVSALPALLSQTGVVRDGKALSFEEMSEALRKEILALNVYFSTNFDTDRAELVVRGAGNDRAESERAVEWMRLVLHSPNWRADNLARIRDVVDQTLGGLRNRTQGSEESWVNDPADAYWRQDNPLLMASSSFLTRAHNVHRLRWMLRDAGAGADREAVAAFLDKLAQAPRVPNADREKLKNLLHFMQKGELRDRYFNDTKSAFTGLPAGAKAHAVEAAKDLDQLLADIPDASLAADWEYLAKQIRHDLLVSPEKTLSDLDALRKGLLKTGGARVFMIGSRATQTALEPKVGALLGEFEKAPHAPVAYPKTYLVQSRVLARTGERDAPVHVGLVNPNTQGGVFLNSAPAASYDDADNRDLVLDYLASRLFAGYGAHGVFIKTWGAGLAYSNGFRGSPSIGRIGYYAERTPELPQTLKFVIDELKKAKPDPGLVEYVIAQAFGQFRSASPYEVRGEQMAADIADRIGPEQVRRFRQSILALRKEPKLTEELYRRMPLVYGSILPGYTVKAKDVRGGVFYVIGPEKQLAAYEQYLKTVEGPDTRLQRIYPRDYWMPLREAGADAGAAGTAGGKR